VFEQLEVVAPNFRLGGYVTAQNGVLVGPGGILQVDPGTRITGDVIVTGEVDIGALARITGRLINDGLVYIGDRNRPRPPGEVVYIYGDYAQSGGGILQVDANGGYSDGLDVAGTAYLGGILSVLVPPNGGVSFAIVISYQSRSGEFDAVFGQPGLDDWYDDPISNAMGVQMT
jgi:hypothetical protein